LHVQLSKDRLDLQAKVDVAKDMDIHMKVKQLGVTINNYYIEAFLGFHYSFKLFKTHNMFILMLDP
jgi:hypothetical protein